MNNRFDLFYSKRVFCHWLICDGMEEGELTEARENSAALVKDYEDEIYRM